MYCIHTHTHTRIHTHTELLLYNNTRRIYGAKDPRRFDLLQVHIGCTAHLTAERGSRESTPRSEKKNKNNITDTIKTPTLPPYITRSCSATSRPG